MADTPDTPTPSTDDAKPAPRRRAAPRKTGASTAAEPRGRKAATAKAGTAAKDGVTEAAGKGTKAVKPRPSSRATPRASTRAAAKTTTKRTTAKKSAGGKSAVDKATSKVGGRWGAAGIVGGVAAAGVAAAALLTLRGSSKPSAPALSKTAHQPDGTDSSASFRAGIADENTIPDKV